MVAIPSDNRSDTIHYGEIAALRSAHYRLSNDLRLKTEREAVRFIDDVGIALLFPGHNIALPDLWSAINGRERAIPKHHHDGALHKTWEWKDRIPSRKEAWYGKLVRGKPAFVSLPDLPAIYALSSNYGELDDYVEAYADGLMTTEAKTIYEVLLREGPMPTSAMRKATGMAGGGDAARRFERAIVELQGDLKIVKCGVSTANRWKYCYEYDVLLRWAPNLAQESRKFNSRTGMRHLISRYLNASVGAPAALFPRLFGWNAAVVERVVEEMAADGSVREVRVLGAPGLTLKSKPQPDGALWILRPDL